jgi:hypothetical protein
MLVLVMVFNTSCALALGFFLGRIYQIRSNELERRGEPPPVARAISYLRTKITGLLTANGRS